MAQFSSTEKIQVVKQYLDDTESEKIIVKSIGVTPYSDINNQ
ncbi:MULTISPECIES: hypothetical protein [Bacillus]|jgi:hypothetical protein|uniref:Transposase n=3 Tax=Bacillus cereus group TaxID=86661 RepID=A0A1Y5YU61_9BACI|nr:MULTISPECIES: hypothetical protein [Bacillus]AAS44459.1 hypothetical protein BCE_5559 [Bacillus cereus ATCC 10987]AFQ09550.1 hypothetical protein BCK_08215 [Bacillus cereus FRI-35]AIE81864.1 transposase [Bacillus cereus]EEK42113.1 hypothetical protein bcere0001_50490 [Bacillus cereus m1293]EJR23106.1 hypothetical protein II9_00146 [Bacillus cereus MSX-D12]EJR44683.1 hypothetical protein IIK_04813 [Bacillus cereus VD102]